MKQKIALLILAMTVATGLDAQEKQVQDPAQSKELNTEAYAHLLRADLKAQKEQIIKDTMQLDDKQSAAFWPVYREYDGELSSLRDTKLAVINDYADNFLTMNDSKADQLAQKVQALDEKKLALRKKYYDAMKKVLPTVLAVRFFQVDNQIQMLVDLQIAANLPIIEEAPGK
jgi:hypothetical protein